MTPTREQARHTLRQPSPRIGKPGFPQAEVFPASVSGEGPEEGAFSVELVKHCLA